MSRRFPTTVIHNPTDRRHPSHSTLSPAQQKLWEETYLGAMDFYGGANLEGSDKELMRTAETTAWKGVTAKNRPRSFRLPDPGDVILLGKVLEFVIVDDPPDITVFRFSAPEPDLLWSERHKMLLVLPHIEIPTDRNPDLEGHADAARGFRRWSRRDPRGATRIEVSDYQLRAKGPADTITYRSDKWGPHDGNSPKSQRYIHQFGPGVWEMASTGNPPRAIIFRGGKLDVRPEGIIN